MSLKNFPKFQTVEWWIDQLKEFPKDAVVHVYTGRGDPYCMLSLYQSDAKSKKVCLDVGEPDE